MDHLRSIFQKNKNLLVFCCCLFLLLYPFSAAATGMRPHPIRVGYTDSPGFIEKTAAGTVDGYGVAYLNEISHYTGWRYEYVYATWQECLELLAKGELDLLGMAQYTPERAASYEFASLPSGVEYMVMYVRNDDNEVYYNDYQSFNGLRIGVLKGNFQTEILSDVARKNTFTYQPVLFDSSKAMVEALQNKQIDAVVTGSMPLYKDLRLVARFQADPIYFITTKGNKAVLQRLNDALMNIHANTPEFENTTYATYYEQSSLLTQPLLTKKERDFLAHRGPITIGFLPNDEPLSAFSSETNLPAGILPGIAKELGRLSGAQVILKLLPAGARLDQSLQKEGFDLIAGITDYEPYRNNISIRLSKPFFQGRVMAVANKNNFIDITKPQKVALPFNYIAYKNLILNTYPHFSIINKANTRDCLLAVADGEADIALQNSHIISYHLQNPRFIDLKILSLFNFPDNLCLAAANNADGSQLLTIFNKCIDTLNPKTLDNIVMYETVQSPYQPLLSDLAYKYNYLIAALLAVLIILFTAWLYFTLQRQKYLELLEAKNLELETAAKQALAASEAKSSFLSRMSHEIRTPLNAIVGFSSILAETDEEQEKREYISIIENNNALLLQLIGDILDLSKIEAGTLEFNFSDFELNELMHEKENIIRMKTAEGVELIFEPGLDACLFHSDRNRLSQLLINLLTNAAKFTAKGSIRFGYRAEGSRLRFYVSDTGCGIPPEGQRRIFDRFVKLNSFKQGTGLGLPICKSIVEHLGGEIGVKSEEGRGTTFWFTLPYVTGKPCETPCGEIPTVSVEKDKLTILIAEDNDSNYRLFETILRRDYRLIHARDGEQAVELCRTEHPHLILMDINMPVMNGYEAAAEIRKFAAEIPIVAVTAYAYASDEQKIMQNGFTGYMPKPINAPQLKKQILDILRERITLI